MLLDTPREKGPVPCLMELAFQTVVKSKGGYALMCSVQWQECVCATQETPWRELLLWGVGVREGKGGEKETLVRFMRSVVFSQVVRWGNRKGHSRWGNSICKGMEMCK